MIFVLRCWRFDTTFERETSMKAIEQLHHMCQSLWLDNIARGLLTSGTIERYTACQSPGSPQMRASLIMPSVTRVL
jgi:hypothetical protein